MKKTRVLIVCSDPLRGRRCADKLSDIAEVSVSAFGPAELSSVLARSKPKAVYIVFRKSEAAVRKEYGPLVRYIISGRARIAVVGSEAQRRAVAAVFSAFSAVDVRRMRYFDIVSELSELNRDSREDERAALPAGQSGAKKHTVLIVSENIEDMSVCEAALRDLSPENGKLELVFADPGCPLPDYLSEYLHIPDAVIFSDSKDHVQAAGVIKRFYSHPAAGRIPYLLLDSGYAGSVLSEGLQKEPFCILGADTQPERIGNVILDMLSAVQLKQAAENVQDAASCP